MLGIFILGLITGFILLIILGIIINNNQKKSKKYRRGIIEKDFITGNNETIRVQYEISEIEKTDKKSKIKVLSLKTDNSYYNNKNEEIKNMIDNTWINTSEIEWIVKPIEEDRNDKINEILK